jgi:hypothetical protein
MNVRKDFLPRLKTQEWKDETLSYSGKPDFKPEDDPEIRVLSSPGTRPRPRSRASELNSYT